MVPTTFRGRLAGIRQAPPGHGVLLAAAAIHSIGLKRSVAVLALDRGGEVLATHELAPNTTWRNVGASWILELPIESATPPAASMVLLEAPNLAES
jgi:hypothetical protein